MKVERKYFNNLYDRENFDISISFPLKIQLSGIKRGRLGSHFLSQSFKVRGIVDIG